MDLGRDGILNHETVDGVAVLSFQRGRIHEEQEILLTLESLSRYVGSKKGLKILLDMSSLEYLSSAGLGHLVGLLKKARATGGSFKLCRLQEPIRELFEVMHLGKIFEIFASVEEALASYAKDEVVAGPS
jgi:anti-sigma B factor antagonist